LSLEGGEDPEKETVIKTQKRTWAWEQLPWMLRTDITWIDTYPIPPGQVLHNPHKELQPGYCCPVFQAGNQDSEKLHITTWRRLDNGKWRKQDARSSLFSWVQCEERKEEETPEALVPGVLTFIPQLSRSASLLLRSHFILINAYEVRTISSGFPVRKLRHREF
jgi:hypothetical protein